MQQTEHLLERYAELTLRNTGEQSELVQPSRKTPDYNTRPRPAQTWPIPPLADGLMEESFLCYRYSNDWVCRAAGIALALSLPVRKASV